MTDRGHNRARVAESVPALVSTFAILSTLENVSIMDFNVSVPSTLGRSFGQNENGDARLARMTAWLAASDNATLVPFGKFLALAHHVDESTKQVVTLAEYIFGGGSFSVDSLVIAGTKVKLAEPQEICLDTCATENGWGCVACRSAHGSGIYPSKRVDIKGLSENKWYYNPATRRIFTISSTCFRDYVTGLDGGKAGKRFVSTVPKNTRVTVVKALPEGSQA
jgi:hypothetical protein